MKLHFTALIPVLLVLMGCSTLDRLDSVGKTPELSAPQNPVQQSGYRPVSLPLPEPQSTDRLSNSLWVPGRKSFFKDQRANQVGDLVTVIINIDDKAEIDNTSERSRDSNESTSFPTLLGFENNFRRVLPGAPSLDPGVSTSSSSKNTGKGSIDRKEAIRLRVAGIITQLLPNGNMVLIGRQEVRVNYEVRELQVAGVIRQEDIATDNTIPFEKIAEARVSYGGRGHISDVQAPRYGAQVLDIILPF
jgi:flagellar L-ring protein precursor FlgH